MQYRWKGKIIRAKINRAAIVIPEPCVPEQSEGVARGDDQGSEHSA